MQQLLDVTDQSESVFDKTCQGGGSFAVLQVGPASTNRTGDLTSPALCADVAVSVTFRYVIMEPQSTLRLLTRCADGSDVGHTVIYYPYSGTSPGWKTAKFSMEVCRHSATMVL